MDLESEIRDLKRRVGDLEGAVNVLAGQLGRVHPDLVLLAQSTEKQFDGVYAGINRLVSRIDLMNTQIWSLRDDMPDLVASAIRRSQLTGD
jgi:hypothetical protein